MRWWIVLFLVLIACSKAPDIECASPNIMIGNVCCIDEDTSGVCDSAEPVIEQPEQIIDPVQEAKPEDTMPEGKEVVHDADTPPPVENQAIKDLLAKAEKRVKSMRYTGHVKGSSAKADFYVKGEVVKVLLLDPLSVGTTELVDTLYFNKTSNQALARCQRVEPICKGASRTLFEISWDYYSDTPIEWLRKFATKEPTLIQEDAEIIESMQTTKIVFEEEGATYTFWVDEFYGVPIQIEEKLGGQTRMLPMTKISFNSVSDEEIEELYKRLD